MVISFFRTFILYAAIVVALRLMGKRQIGELEPSELVITILAVSYTHLVASSMMPALYAPTASKVLDSETSSPPK